MSTEEYEQPEDDSSAESPPPGGAPAVEPSPEESVSPESADSPTEIQPAWRSRLRLLRRIVVRGFLGVVSLYLIVVMIGLVPVNNGFTPDPDGVEIFVSSSAVHADVVMPIDTEWFDWRDVFPPECFTGPTWHTTHVAIGWGDKGFFIETPEWSDLTVSNALSALFWSSEAAMHVTMTAEEYLGEGTRAVWISAEQYQVLVEYVLATFETDGKAGRIQIEGAHYFETDAFFEAKGSYNCLNTCNSWIGDALKACGVRTPWLTPLPKTMFLYLP